MLAQGAGAFFVRSYERGERVHLAMLSRGYTGSLPGCAQPTSTIGDWLVAGSPAARGLPWRPWPRGCCDERLAASRCWRSRDLAYAYPDGHQALYGVNLTVARGERVAMLGPNGAGKTTLVLHLNGIIEAGHGSVDVAGMRVGKDTVAEVRRRVGLVFQDPDDQLFMPSVADDVAFGPANAGVKGAELDARVADALEQVGMAEFANRPPHHLSFGQRRRVAVATVLAMQPEILVLDEPSSNLDPASRRELADDPDRAWTSPC